MLVIWGYLGICGGYARFPRASWVLCAQNDSEAYVHCSFVARQMSEQFVDMLMFGRFLFFSLKLDSWFRV